MRCERKCKDLSGLVTAWKALLDLGDFFTGFSHNTFYESKENPATDTTWVYINVKPGYATILSSTRLIYWHWAASSCPSVGLGSHDLGLWCQWWIGGHLLLSRMARSLHTHTLTDSQHLHTTWSNKLTGTPQYQCGSRERSRIYVLSGVPAHTPTVCL